MTENGHILIVDDQQEICDVVQEYLTRDEPATSLSESFGARATALVRSYKRDLDHNRSALDELKRELGTRDYRLTEVRILDLLIWSVNA